MFSNSMVMAKKKYTETNLVQGNISAELKEKLDIQLDDLGFQIGKAVSALAEFYTKLPREAQIEIYTKSSTTDFEKIVSTMVNSKLDSFLESLEKNSRLSKSRLALAEIRKVRHTSNTAGKAG